MKVPMSDQPDFIYFECPDCVFSSVQKKTFSGSHNCPLCSEDNGHEVRMKTRICHSDDKPEGYDARAWQWYLRFPLEPR